MYEPRVVLLTQRLDADDAVLGFVHGWVAALALLCEHVTVVPLRLGRVDLPPNVDVVRMPRDPLMGTLGRGVAMSRRVGRILRREHPDLVIAHMCPEYALLAAPWCRVFRARLALWYAHGRIGARLRLAAALSDVVLTSTTEGFGLPDPKKRVVGQGVDVHLFRPSRNGSGAPQEHTEDREHGGRAVRIASVARLSESKGQDTMVDAVRSLVDRGRDVQLDLVGAPLTKSDERYRDQLARKVESSGLSARVSFHGAVANSQLPSLLAPYDLFWVMSSTGSLDKAILEAMAMEAPVVGYNAAWAAMLPSDLADILVSDATAGRLADKTDALLEQAPSRRDGIGRALRDIVIHDHSLGAFAGRLLKAALG